MSKRFCALALGLGLLALAAAYGQSAPGADTLRSGIQLFAEGRFEEALPLFDALFLDTSAGTLRPEGAYWAAMSHMARGDAAAGQRAIDTFLALYPTHARAAEMMYQRGRAAFILRDYGRALESFSAYLGAYPKADNLSAAIFWSAESLYAVGRLSEAEKLYRTVAELYPDSVKAEAARYRMALVQFKYREDELLTLLKWSHEESLRIIEEFQRREKAYEQALAVYQKRYGEAQYGTAVAQSTLEEEIASLKASMDDLAKRLQEKDARVAQLEADLAALSAMPAPAAVAAPAVDSSALAQAEELLALKARALALLQFYLESMAGSGTGGGK